eukprot:6724069-Pyramimonas_sp.AAC.2
MRSSVVPPSPLPQEEARPRARQPAWSRFDIQISPPDARRFNPTIAFKELRKLHLRWHRASEPEARAIPSRVGLDLVRLNMMKGVVDSHRERRAWEKTCNAIVPSMSSPGTQ